MFEHRNVRTWQQEFREGKFDAYDISTQCNAGWYDWFCKSSSLRNKTYRMGRIINQVKDGGKIDLDKMYCWFKNNCPVIDPLYDDFRFADCETGNTIFTICCDDRRENYKYVVYGRSNGFEKPLAEFNRSRDLVKWLNSK